MKKVGKERINWPVTILLIAGVITVIFPLYMTVVIALKKPSEMTNDIAGILSLPKHFSLSNFAEAMKVTDFWNSLGNSLLITIVTVVFAILIHSLLHLFLRCQRYVRTICNPDDAGGKTDGADGTCEQSRSYYLISGLLYADECAFVFRISDEYSDGTGRSSMCGRTYR